MEDYTPAAAKQQQQQPKPQRDAAPAAKQQQPKPQRGAAPAAKPVAADDPSQDLKLPEGLIPYDHKTTRQLLEELDAAIEEAAVAAVPEMPAISISALGGAAILEAGTLSSSSGSATPGAYGSGRALLESDAAEAVGGYGGRSLLGSSGQGEGVGTYGSASGRSLLEEAAAAKQAAAKKDDQSKADKKAQKPAEKKNKPADNPKPQSAPKKDDQGPKKPSSPAQEQRPSSPPQKQQAPTDSSSSSAAPCSAAAGNATAPNGRPFGICYCRYNPKDSTWALEQAACRAALFQRCKTAGSMLECSQVDAFYRGLAMPGSEAPHRDSLSAFLYADCPPAPPCSCKALLSGSETATARARCCTDLQAHCQVPFSGLDCEDVGRFCRPYGRQSSDPMGALFSYVLVKTHGFDCSSPKYAVSYASVVAGAVGANGGRTSEADEAMRQLSKAAMVEGISRFDAQQRLSSDEFSEQDRVAVLATMLVGGCIAVFVAAAGVALIFKMVSTRNHHTTPLLSDRL